MKLVAFGIRGDLMRLKILPALAGLHAKGTLGDMKIIGVSRQPWNDEYLQEYVQGIVGETDAAFLERFTFIQGETDGAETFRHIRTQIGEDEALVYFSVAPGLYAGALERMQTAGFPRTVRVVLEKPLGRSGAEAALLYETLKTITDEKNIFLVDHYVFKDWVRGLGNTVRSQDVAEIEVRFLEELGVEKRGTVYDQLGVLRDVGQNHMLQILAQCLGAHERLNVLKALVPLTPEDISTHTVRAQYEGYKDIVGVASNSETETYFRINALCGSVKIILEAGKRMPLTSKEVVIRYRDGSTMHILEKPNVINEYEAVLSAALRGDKTLFPSIEEVLVQWNFIDPIEQTWATGTPELKLYAPGSKP
jgi:glucose-6-phosphate 1-dehydrogenase